MKIWVDDIRPVPFGYVLCRSVKEAKRLIEQYNNFYDYQGNRIDYIEVLSLDHDAGEFALDGGDYIRILDWMEEKGYNNIPIHIHSMNPVGVKNMRRIIQRNHWKEV